MYFETEGVLYSVFQKLRTKTISKLWVHVCSEQV